MCLHVERSHALQPIPQVPIYKELTVSALGLDRIFGKKKYGFFTPYRYSLIAFGDGYFDCKQPYNTTQEFSRGSTLSGGFLHSFSRNGTKPNNQTVRIVKLTEKNTYARANFHFKGLALDVVATGYYKDYVSHRLYLPQFDLRNYTKEEIVWLKKAFGASFNTHSANILKQIRSK